MESQKDKIMNDIEANLILKDADILIGYKQVVKAISAGLLKAVVLALNTDEPIAKKVYAAAAAHNLHVIPYSDKTELGRAVNIQVGCAVVGIRKK